MILDEPEMLISFLKKFVPVDMLKNVRPSDVVKMLLTKIDVPEEEISDVADRIYERGVSEMFNNFNVEGYSVRETRKEERTRFARRLLARKRPIEEVVEDTELTREEVEELLKEQNSAGSH